MTNTQIDKTVLAMQDVSIALEKLSNVYKEALVEHDKNFPKSIATKEQIATRRHLIDEVRESSQSSENYRQRAEMLNSFITNTENEKTT